MFNIVLMRFILASTYTIGKAATVIVKPLFFIGIAMTCSGCLLLAWCWNKSLLCAIRSIDRGAFLQLAIYQVYLPYAIDFYIAQYVSSSKWALIHATTPFATALLSWFLLQESLTLKKCWGLSIGLLGIALTFMQQNIQSVSGGSVIVLPELVLVCSMLAYSYSWIFIQKFTSHYNLFFINGIITFLGGALALASSVIFESCIWECPIYKPYSFMLLLLIKIGIVIIGFPLYTYLLKQYSVTFLAFSSFLEPIFVAFLGWLFFSEVISIYFVIACIFLTFGLYMFYKEELLPASLNIKEV